MAVKKDEVRAVWKEVWGIILIALCALVLLSLLSYRPDDIPLVRSPPNKQALNFVGPVGAWMAYVTFMALGVIGYLLPLGIGLGGTFLIFKRTGRTWPKALWMLGIIVSLACLLEIVPGQRTTAWAERLNVGGAGGALGDLVANLLLVPFLGVVGTGILSVALLAACFILLVEVRPVIIAQKVGLVVVTLYRKLDEVLAERRDKRQQIEREQRDIEKRRRRLEEAMREQKEAARQAPAPAQPAVRPAVFLKPTPPAPAEPPAPPPPRRERPRPQPAETGGPRAPAPARGSTSFALPQAHLLDPVPPAKDREIKGDFQASTNVLKETLAEFGIEVDVTNIQRGPVITRYELLPAPGVRVEKIGALSNNIALAMKAESIRIQAPIPGKGVVGIEVPNPKTTLVYLREIVESAAWQSTRAALPLALGKDVGGREIIGDLAEMPHLLIAGATGSGKTVCINSVIAGLLMSRTPEQMRLMLIDPKIVEFSVYNHLPHLVVPVITDPKKVAIGLRWAITEMEKRYKLFAKVGVRNIEAFNTRPIFKQAQLPSMPPPDEEEGPAEIPDRVPYIIIIVDELADLMLVAQADIENGIARLAQLSRAVGIHMILATQRPSVNVITGTIKANFPARLSFQVAQKVDSRTILDANGADKLLGKGDMLFLPPGTSRLVRAQGTMTNDQEIRRLVEFLKKQGQPQYEAAIKDRIESNMPDLPEGEEDELMDAALEIIRQTKRASTSSLQRRLRIGYTRAARLMDILEARGIVGPASGSDPREILVDLDGEIPENRPEPED